MKGNPQNITFIMGKTPTATQFFIKKRGSNRILTECRTGHYQTNTGRYSGNLMLKNGGAQWINASTTIEMHHTPSPINQVSVVQGLHGKKRARHVEWIPELASIPSCVGRYYIHQRVGKIPIPLDSTGFPRFPRVLVGSTISLSILSEKDAEK